MSRFQELNQNINDVIMRMLESQNLCKLLYYNTNNPLNEANIQNTSSLVFNNIYPIPKIPRINEEKKSLVIVILDDFNLGRKNPYFKVSKIVFNCMSHIDLWKISGGIRLYSIMHEIDQLFNEQDIIGIGKLRLDRAKWIPVNDDYHGYQLSYSVRQFN